MARVTRCGGCGGSLVEVSGELDGDLLEAPLSGTSVDEAHAPAARAPGATEQLALLPRPAIKITYEPDDWAFNGDGRLSRGSYLARALHAPREVAGIGADEATAIRALADDLRDYVRRHPPVAGLLRSDQLLTAAARLDRAALVAYLHEICLLPPVLSDRHHLVLR